MEDQENRMPLETSIPVDARNSTLIEIAEMTKEKRHVHLCQPKMYRIKETIDQVANTDVTVLIPGRKRGGQRDCSPLDPSQFPPLQ